MNTFTNIDGSDLIVDKDAEKFAVDKEMKSSIVEVINAFEVGNINSAHSFGRLNESVNKDYLDELLENANSSSNGKDSGKLNEIVALARDISNAVEPSFLQKKFARIPYAGPLLLKLLRMHFSAMDRFDSVKGQIDILTSDINTISTSLISMNSNIDIMYDDALMSVKTTGINIVAAGYLITKLQSVLDTIKNELKEQQDNSLLGMEAMNIDHQITLLTKRRKDMIMEQQKAIKDLKMMKMMRFNNLSMVDQFETIINVTIPASKRSHLIIDQAEKSDKSSLLIQAIGDSVNQQARRQAILVKESSIRVAKTANRTVYDIDTLEFVFKTISEAGREIKKIHDSSKNQHLLLENRVEQWKQKRSDVARELSSK